ncbi:MAG: signal peptidase I [Actinomycetota bacterium]
MALQAAVGAALVLAWFSFLAPRAVGGPISVIWVSGFSMQPTLHTGDLAVLYERDRYHVGDIVAFDIPEGGTVIHRIVEVRPEGYVFQGDNRERLDPWLLDEGAIHGRQVFAVPQAAQVMGVLGRPPILAALVAASVFFFSLHSWGTPARRS